MLEQNSDNDLGLQNRLATMVICRNLILLAAPESCRELLLYMDRLNLVLDHRLWITGEPV